MNFDLDTDEGLRNAVEWQNALFATINNWGVWVVPRSGTFVHVHHDTHEVSIVPGFMPDPSLERVIRAAGWKIRAAGQEVTINNAGG